MKTTLTMIIAVATIGCGNGCKTGYTGTLTPLQPGDLILFKGTNGPARANAFRAVSLNDAGRTGSVVEISQPTTIITE